MAERVNKPNELPICYPETQDNRLHGLCPTRQPNPNGSFNPANQLTTLPGFVTLGTTLYVRIDCRDATGYLALNTPAFPLDNMVGRRNNLLDVSWDKTSNAYELILRGNQDFSHQTGFANGNGWSANVSTTGYLSYGPYTTALPTTLLTADFRFVSDSNAAPNVPAVNLDIYDATAGVVLGSSLIYRQSFAAPNQEASFKLNFNMAGRPGHAIEFRAYTYGASTVGLNKVVIQPTP